MNPENTISEDQGDINTSEQRSLYNQSLDKETLHWLEEDAKYFFHQALSTPVMNVLSKTEGAYIYDLNGKKYLDMHGNGVHNAGFNNPTVVEAMIRQMTEALAFTPRRYTNIPAIQLAKKLTDPVITPSGEQIICADSSIALTVNVSSINTVTWSNGLTGRTINVKTPGTYTARLSNIYGCSSPTLSAPVTVKTISVQAPKLIQSGPYSVQATPDSTIFSFADTKVSSITWDWRQGGRSLTATESAIKVTQTGEFTTRSRVTFVANSGGIARTCLSPFSAAVLYRPTGETNDGLVVYPNPSRLGKVAIETLEDLTDVEITVTSLSGQVVYSGKFPDLKIRKEIDLSYVNEGAYILKLTSTTLKQSKRIIIDN